MDPEELKPWQVLQARSGRAGARLQLRLAGLNAVSGLLAVAYAVLATLSTQISLQQSLFRGYLLLLLAVAGFLFAALALAGLVGASLERQAARRELERLPAEVRQGFPPYRPPAAARFLGGLAAWGTCILWMLFWVVIFVVTSRLI